MGETIKVIMPRGVGMGGKVNHEAKTVFAQSPALCMPKELKREKSKLRN